MAYACVCNRIVIKLTIICFENNIKNLLNVAKRITINGIRQCGTETHDIHRKFLLSLHSLVLRHRYVIIEDSMNGSQLMGLDSVSIDIYDIHGYFRELTVGQRTPGFWGVTT